MLMFQPHMAGKVLTKDSSCMAERDIMTHVLIVYPTLKKGFFGVALMIS
jgi:hypothetical protein